MINYFCSQSVNWSDHHLAGHRSLSCVLLLYSIIQEFAPKYCLICPRTASRRRSTYTCRFISHDISTPLWEFSPLGSSFPGPDDLHSLISCLLIFWWMTQTFLSFQFVSSISSSEYPLIILFTLGNCYASPCSSPSLSVRDLSLHIASQITLHLRYFLKISILHYALSSPSTRYLVHQHKSMCSHTFASTSFIFGSQLPSSFWLLYEQMAHFYAK